MCGFAWEGLRGLEIISIATAFSMLYYVMLVEFVCFLPYVVLLFIPGMHFVRSKMTSRCLGHEQPCAG